MSTRDRTRLSSFGNPDNHTAGGFAVPRHQHPFRRTKGYARSINMPFAPSIKSQTSGHSREHGKDRGREGLARQDTGTASIHHGSRASSVTAGEGIMNDDRSTMYGRVPLATSSGLKDSSSDTNSSVGSNGASDLEAFCSATNRTLDKLGQLIKNLQSVGGGRSAEWSASKLRKALSEFYRDFIDSLDGRVLDSVRHRSVVPGLPSYRIAGIDAGREGSAWTYDILSPLMDKEASGSNPPMFWNKNRPFSPLKVATNEFLRHIIQYLDQVDLASHDSETIKKRIKELRGYYTIDVDTLLSKPKPLVDPPTLRLRYFISRVNECCGLFDERVVSVLQQRQKTSYERLTNMTIIATFFSSVTATTIGFSLPDGSNSKISQITNAINIVWEISLTFSILSALTSLLGMSWRASKISVPERALPPRLLQGFNNIPMINLIGAAVTFIIGLILFVLSSEGHPAFVIVTSIILLHGMLLLVVFYYFVISRRPINATFEGV